MTEKEMEKDAQEFWDRCEKEASRLELTIDYYLMEFVDGFELTKYS